jgi:hypothetical protein
VLHCYVESNICSSCRGFEENSRTHNSEQLDWNERIVFENSCSVVSAFGTSTPIHSTKNTSFRSICSWFQSLGGIVVTKTGPLSQQQDDHIDAVSTKSVPKISECWTWASRVRGQVKQRLPSGRRRSARAHQERATYKRSYTPYIQIIQLMVRIARLVLLCTSDCLVPRFCYADSLTSKHRAFLGHFCSECLIS